MKRCVLGVAAAVFTLHAVYGQIRFSGPETVGRLQSVALKETSGLAISRRSSGNLWAINNSGNTPQLHLLRIDGAEVGYATVLGVQNRDWEDLASFTLEGEPYLLIAAAFSRPPIQLTPHRLNGCENAAFSSDGNEIFLTAEGQCPPIIRYRRLR